MVELSMGMFVTKADYWQARAEAAERALAEAKKALEPMVWTGRGPYGMSPTAPEGSQEAVAWRVRGAQYDRVFLDEVEARGIAEGFLGLVTPLYPRPAEQAVTEAMVETAARAYAEHQHGKGYPVWEEELPPMRAAIKAAMEAGR